MRHLVLCVAVMLAAGPAWANRKEAARYFTAGQQAYEKQKYDTAIRAFELSQKAKPHPATAFALAQSYRHQFQRDQDVTKLKRSIDLYRRFLKLAPRSPWRATAERQLLQLVAVLARRPQDTAAVEKAATKPTQLMITSKTPGARIRIDGAPKGGEPAPAIRTVPPGSHQVEVTADGYLAVKTAVAAVKERLILQELTLEPLPGSLRVMSNVEAALVYLDGKPVGRTPHEQAAVAPGTRSLALTARGRKSWSGALSVESGRTAAALATLPISRQRKAAYATFAGAGLLAVAGMTTGLLALGADSALDGMPYESNEDRRIWDKRLDGRDRLATASTVLLSTAGAALVAAILLYWFDMPEAPVVPAGKRAAWMVR
jgi:hypothetical protein